MTETIEQAVTKEESHSLESRFAIEQKIIKTVAETLRIEETSISLESKFVDDLGADSLDLVELMMAIEAVFDCDIPDGEASKISTVLDAVKYVERHINA